jgi:phage repressor protein C with HTH and peptisase S24 domain
MALMDTAHRMNALMLRLGITQSALARRIGVTQATIGKLATGSSSGSRYMHKIARELGTTAAYLMGETDDPALGALPAPSANLIAEQVGVVPVREIDLTFGMGATYLEVPVTIETRYFSAEWIRLYTRANPDMLVFAQGIGDSMAPTILDSDLLLIDLSQQNINMGDKIWAIAYGHTGMIKRLRPMPDGSVKILSDNPSVPSDVAVDGEMSVLGRVVAVVRKT